MSLRKNPDGSWSYLQDGNWYVIGGSAPLGNNLEYRAGLLESQAQEAARLEEAARSGAYSFTDGQQSAFDGMVASERWNADGTVNADWWNSLSPKEQRSVWYEGTTGGFGLGDNDMHRFMRKSLDDIYRAGLPPSTGSSDLTFGGGSVVNTGGSGANTGGSGANTGGSTGGSAGDSGWGGVGGDINIVPDTPSGSGGNVAYTPVAASTGPAV